LFLSDHEIEDTLKKSEDDSGYKHTRMPNWHFKKKLKVEVRFSSEM